MKTIVFIETNKSGSSREAIKAAERLGFFTVLLTNKQKLKQQRIEFPDVHLMINMELSDINKLKETIKKLEKQGFRIKGIMSLIDPFVHVAAALTEEFCPSVVASDPILNMEDKVLTRKLLKGHPMSPQFEIYSQKDSFEDFINKQKEFFPLIVKSPVSTGSKDVFLANNENELRRSMQSLLTKNNENILIEEFLSGPQYLIEAVVYKRRVHIVAIIEQEITFINRFIVTGYCLLAEVNFALYSKIYEAASSIIRAFQMENGTCHLEMRLVKGELKLIEINPRISGGAMNRIIEAGFGINLVEETIQLMLGKEPNLRKKRYQFVYVQYLTVDSKGKLVKVTGKNRSSQYPGVEEVYIKPRKGQILRPPLSMGDRYGYVLAASNEKEEAKRIAIDASSEIRFHLEPL